jgi:putative ABC transport system permease protein
MSAWRHVTRGLRVLARRTAADRDLADEVDHYVEQATAAYIEQGLSADDARRTARMEVGSTTRVREDVRDGGWEHVIETLIADLRYGARRLRRSPASAFISILTLALGIGSSTAIFSAVHPILFAPLPYPEASRVVMIWDTLRDGGRLDVTFGTYREVHERSRAFDDLAVMRPWQPTITDATEPERLDGQRVSARFFHTLGVLPAQGRSFESADDRVGGPRVAIISDGLWKRRFGGRTDIVGRDITLDDALFTVIGIMPGAFENVLAPSAEVWTPLQYDLSLPVDGREWGHHLRMVARLRTGTDPQQATRELDVIAEQPIPQFARPRWASLELGLAVNPLQDDISRDIKPALLAVVGAAVLVLMIACVNVTNLLLARGAQRRGELAMRVALGAPRRRVVRQLITESLLLASLGGILGLVIAAAGVRALLLLAPADLPRADAIVFDGAVFAFALGITTLVGLFVGLIPALAHAPAGGLHAVVELGARRSAGGHAWIRRTLVVAEIALALVLLVGAGLLLRSVSRLFAVAPGFDTNNVLTMQVQTSGRRFRNAEATHRFFAAALQSVGRIPGISGAALTSQLPLSGEMDKYGVHFESVMPLDPEEDQAAFRYGVSAGYFETLRLPLRSGRLLDGRDVAGAPGAIVISESLARRKFPTGNVLGQRVRVGPSNSKWFAVVGVVGDVKQTSLAVTDADAVYVTTTQWHFADNVLWLVVRTHGTAGSFAPAIRDAIWSVDKDQPIVRVSTMAALLAASSSERTFALMLFELFAATALVLAAIGIYGILSGSVAERTREIGIRSALGASRTTIVSLIVGEGMMLSVVGIALGLTAAIIASQAVVSLLFGVTRLDPITYAGVIMVIGGVAAIAGAVPAYRAARVDPSITLRME